MNTPATSPNHWTDCGNNTFVSEASDLGLGVGQAPGALTIKQQKIKASDWERQYKNMPNEEREFTGWKASVNGYNFTIFND